MLTLTAHSVESIVGRLGIDSMATLKWLETAKEVTYAEANGVASIFHPHKLNRYYIAPDPKLVREWVVLIVRDNNLVTMMTRLTNVLYGVEAKMVGLDRMIRTLDGGVIYDGSNWTRKLRKRSKKAYSR